MSKGVFIGFGVVLLGGGIAYYLYTQKKLFENISVSPVGLAINNLSLTNVNVNLKLLFTSTVDIEAKVKHVDLDVYFEGTNIGRVTDIKPFILPAHANSFVDINLSVNPSIILASAADLINGTTDVNKLKATVSLVGYAKIDTGIIGISVPISYSKDLIDHPTPQTS